MSEQKTIVYCQDCKHKRFVDGAMGCCGSICKANPKYYNSAIQPCTLFADCEKKNKDNNCKDYEVKRRWWRG